MKLRRGQVIRIGHPKHGYIGLLARDQRRGYVATMANWTSGYVPRADTALNAMRDEWQRRNETVVLTGLLKEIIREQTFRLN